MTDNVENAVDVSNFIPEDDQDAGGLPHSLAISIHSKVMLIRNIATDYGLVNGALGFVQFENSSPCRIFVKFDDPHVGCLFYDDEHEAVSIEKVSKEHFCKDVIAYYNSFQTIVSHRN